MRLILIAAASALALVACDRQSADDRASARPRAVQGVKGKPDRKITAAFDCDRARGQAQELICADANLAAMDREAKRLGRADPSGQSSWATDRDACGRADELRMCVMANAVLRIHHLRKASPEAGGISVGPVGFRCEGFKAPLLVTFINSDPGAAAVESNGQIVALDRAEAASGARYVGRWNGEEWSFWEHGGEATLTVPGNKQTSCKKL
ncbi:MAG: MliC family protein [Sphingomicrobium sp.]